MTQKILLSFLAAAFLLTAGACKKYEYGPYFSLTSKKARVAGAWKVDSAVTRLGDEVGATFSGYIFAFERDGSLQIDFPPFGTGQPATLEGTWDLEEENDLLVWKDLTGDTLGFYYSRNESFDILRLTDQDFWLADKDNTFLYLSPE